MTIGSPPLAYAASSSLTSWVGMIVRALEARGIDGRALAARAGLDVSVLDDSNARYAVAATTRLWRLAVDTTGDSSFGLFVSRFVRHTTLHALGYSVVASRTLKDAFGRMVRYSRIVSDSIRVRVEEERTLSRLIVDVPLDAPRPADEALDAALAVIVRMVRLLHDDRAIAPLSVALQRPIPAAVAPFERFFRAPLRFGAPSNWLEFSKAMMEAVLPSGNAELAHHSDIVARSYLARVNEEQLTSRVRAIVANGLPSGRPTQAAVARALGMSLRSLQRRLIEEGTSYKEILLATRRDLARAYVREARFSVTEIAFLLGFLDASSFCRAYKRWTGHAPGRSRSGAARSMRSC